MHPTALLIDGDKRRQFIRRVPKIAAQGQNLGCSATVILKKDETAERVFFEDQALLGADRFTATTDQQHLPDLLP
jgi:hypothetical protein